MTTTRRTLTALLTCLLSLLCGLAIAQSTTVTVTDNNSPESPITRWVEFATTVSASVDNPPQSTTETTITGPTYSWSITSQTPSSPTISIAPSNSDSTTLQSPAPSTSVCLGAGYNDVSVQCIVTYTSTDNKSGAQTPLTYNGSGLVQFFVRIPSNVIKNGGVMALSIPAGDLGHDDAYPLRIMDNQLNPQPYANGLPHETFANVEDPSGQPISASVLNAGGPDTWFLAQNAQHYDTGPGSPNSDFTDYWQDLLTPAQVQQVVKMTGQVPPPNTPLDSFDQPWYCLELTPPDNPTGQPYNLYVIPNQFQSEVDNPQLGQFEPNVYQSQLTGGAGSTHHGVDQLGESFRSYPGQAPY